MTKYTKPTAKATSSVDPFKAPRLKHTAGKHGFKRSEQKRLSKIIKINVTGQSHESEHAIGFAVLAHGSGIERGVGQRARTLENIAPAYQEAAPAHRAHIGTGSQGTPDQSGFHANSYRDAQRNAIEEGHVGNAVQLNQLAYAHNPSFRIAPPSHLQAADQSFNTMVEHMQGLHFASGPNNLFAPVSPQEQAEMVLARRTAVTKQWPTIGEENQVRGHFGLPPVAVKP